MKTKIVPTGLITAFKKTWKKQTGQRVHDINLGWCYQFALILHRIHGDAVKICSTYAHVWIEFDGKHYDSEHKQGVKFPLDHYGYEYLTPIELEYEWEHRGISGPVRWDIINEVADLYLPPKKKQIRFRNTIKVFLRLKGSKAA